MTQYNLPFGSEPIIVDVTYKALEEKYNLCSAVIYMKELKKHIVFFQAIIKGLTAAYFKAFLMQLFEIFDIDPATFLGVIIDFSASQRLGFYEVCSAAFGLSSQGSLYLPKARVPLIIITRATGTNESFVQSLYV